MDIDLNLSLQVPCHVKSAQPEPQFLFLFHEPKYEDFFHHFLSKNVPCILSCGVTDKWDACKNWVDARGEPDLQDICKYFGDIEVPVANCSEKYFDSQPKTQQTLDEYATYMRQPNRQGCLYLKDWHLQREQRLRRPEDPPFYRTPRLVASDWLNEFWEARPEKADDYRFVYVGVAGTWTPFHADVYRSYSWSANVCGAKRWILLPPGEEEKLRSLSGLPFDVASVLNAESAESVVSSEQVRTGVRNSDGEGEGGEKVVPLQPRTSADGVRYFDVRQEAGEVMFVPSGWHHQVWNLRDTISINHNWFNASNVHLVCDHLMASLADVRAELADIADGSDEFLSQCQTLLRATHGMDLAEMAELLCFTINRRLAALAGGEPVMGLDGYRYGRGHLVYDVKICASRELRRLLAREEFGRLEELKRWRTEAERLLEELEVLDLTVDGTTGN
ncbi:2-oxoglutarate and iron-dependent oxygenase JMJD4-like isoform X2 [Amphibalanus amphitrite]|uniref:2-oxoglutarate and iron-dependent oxygenase JMJD4-like isoform X2 n=2 Tax=Amphibalanus amphitrite TaxID=1232801 RepID=UPI001C90AAC2|nr:2-oxoglutarate and iron-dependent oxygenase JMJD4-like isoform X2 [Amphibalanus amphitrite]XP_043221834.1 2-oxoglutarate and iron-dependent oxygenase JMJD4-like isoform X2 [Amphibalanus amphitrite]